MTTPHTQAAFAALPEILRETLTERNETTHLLAETVATLCTHLDLDQGGLGLLLLPYAASFAEAPISHFHVGAVAFDSAGNAYLGANFEFSATHIGQVIHAEQSAIAHAWAHGAKDLARLVINYAPCGHCRQFMNEVNVTPDFRILLPEHPPKPLSDYLPNAFGPADLDVSARILGQEKPSGAEALALAQSACARSHAPYSGSRSSIVLVYPDGDMVAGSYAENAAFNPSLPALQMALNTRRLQGKHWQNPEHAVMVEARAGLSQRDNARALLHTLNPAILFNEHPFNI